MYSWQKLVGGAPYGSGGGRRGYSPSRPTVGSAPDIWR